MYDGFYSSLKTKKTSLHTLESYTFIGGNSWDSFFWVSGSIFLGVPNEGPWELWWHPNEQDGCLCSYTTILRVYYTYDYIQCMFYLHTVPVVSALPPLLKFVNWSGNIEIGYWKSIWDDCLDDFHWVFGFPMPPKFSNGRSWTWLLFVCITTKLRSCKRL